MITQVKDVQPIRKLMNGPDCPVHKKSVWWLSTTNPWVYYCPDCDKRYNDKFELMEEDDTWR